MNPIHLNLPIDAVQRGAIYPTKRLDYLVQDMLEVQVGNDVFIDVAWWPQRDPAGKYVVSVFRSVWEEQLKPQFFTKEYQKAVAKVEKWAKEFSSHRVYEIDCGSEVLLGSSVKVYDFSTRDGLSFFTSRQQQAFSGKQFSTASGSTRRNQGRRQTNTILVPATPL